ncbi:M28 family metallopeptidase [Sphingomonas cavernae]|uniref:M20/M25/M40 family metallo-hydrolase n=1 Tax=Sphingomonas cavernae TaxID=2320861 RepID=A0A418WQ26_9SPHN|nr:M28 family metallopeptidase [Sphingomonas cavernae]RJF93352.1 M20/M25/M40 family metallo-hydrolase [Sphingomonas cavernae]
MKFPTIAAALALVSASTAAIAQSDAQPEFRPEAVRAHVEFLADDLLEGRDAGTRGYDIAARYVATRFEALGLKPAADGGWYQQVPFVEMKLKARDSAAITIGNTRFANAGDVLIGAETSEARDAMQGEVVFVGFGLDKPELGFDDYAGLDVKGKIVAVLSGAPKGTPSEIGAHLASEKNKMAAARGAIGVISIQTLERQKLRPWARTVQFADEPDIAWADAAGKAHSDTPEIRFTATLNTPAADALFKGAPKTLSTILAQADKKGGKPKGFALKSVVKMEREVQQRRFTSPNVVAVLPGSDPALAGEYVLLMAHLDHEGVKGDAKDGDKIYNGAMDNAAGIATMLEVARAMAAAPDKPKRPVVFAAVTAEEDGLLGSEYLARHPLTKDGKVVGVVNLDMPILLYDFTDVIAFGAEHSTLGPITAKAAASAGVKLSPDPLPQEGLFTRSDHYRFVQQGIPSIFLMTGFANGGEKAFQSFLSTHYHRVSDQIDLPFNWDASAKFAKINYLIAKAIADAPIAPRWYAGSFFGDTFAAAQEKAPATRAGK